MISDISVLNFEEDGDVYELITCVDELNTSNDLTVKFKTSQKIIRYIQEQTKEESKAQDDKPAYEIEADKHKKTVSNAMNNFGKFTFGAKAKLADHPIFDPEVKQTINQCKNSLEDL
jgi:hypothetical protein